MSKHARSAATLPIDGVQQETVEGWTFPVRNPATGEVLWQVADAGVDDARTAAQAAWRAFHETPWSTDTALRAEQARVTSFELVPDRDMAGARGAAIAALATVSQ